MKIAVVSHIAIDQIETSKQSVVTVGGPACYSGLTVKSLSHDAHVITKVGRDFEYMEMLRRKGLVIRGNFLSEKPTTRFRIAVDGNNRKLFLLTRCGEITVDDVQNDVDACVISPIINEISLDVVKEMSRRTDFTFVDPQGFVRKVSEDGSCYLERTPINFSSLGVDAIKVDREEAYALTGSRGTDALFKLNLGTAILTIDNRTLMLHNQRVFEVAVDIVQTNDTTGAGDIFTGAYTAAFMETNDAEWALCYAVSASVTALKTNKFGIEKIPRKEDVETLASSLHNDVRILTV